MKNEVSGWIKCFSKTHKAEYWFNQIDGSTSWEMPCSKRIKLHNESNEIKNLIVDVKSKTKIAIIVPYRDLHKEQQRAKQLEIFVNEMQSFLEPDVYKIFIVEQSNDERKFNRGKLLNIGFKLANDLDYNVFVFHDVDLIPSIELQSYYKEPVSQNPVHIASVWNRYNKNEKYFGGVVSFSKELFSKINGFPNNFWGWGGEDDELFARIEKNNMKAIKPETGSFRDLENMDLNEKIKFLKTSKVPYKCMNKYELLKEHEATWTLNGLNTLKFDVVQTIEVSKSCVKFIVDVNLNNHWTDAFCGILDNKQIPDDEKQNHATKLSFEKNVNKNK